MRTWEESFGNDARRTIRYPYDTSRAIYHSGRPMILKALLIACAILVTPILFFCISVTLTIDSALWAWHRLWAPPYLLAPGNRISDHLDLVQNHPSLRTSLRRSKKHTHEHHTPFPVELIEQVLQHEDVLGRKTLLSCALVCPCWLQVSRALSFRSISASKQRAYTLVRLLRSPHCSFQSNIQRITLKDVEGWRTSGVLLRQISLMHTISPTQLHLRLDSLHLPTPNAPFATRITHLHLHLTHRCPFKRKISKFVRFIFAFPQLEDLAIQYECVDFEDDLAPGSALHINNLHHLRISSYSGTLNSRTTFCPNANLLLPILRSGPQLKSLDLVETSIRGFSRNALQEVSQYLISGKCAQLKHLSLTCSIWNLDPGLPLDLVNGIECLLSLGEISSTFPFPELESLGLRFEYGRAASLPTTPLVPWITTLLRSCPETLNEVLFLDSSGYHPLDGLGLTGTPVKAKVWLYQRGEGVVWKGQTISPRLQRLIA